MDVFCDALTCLVISAASIFVLISIVEYFDLWEFCLGWYFDWVYYKPKKPTKGRALDLSSFKKSLNVKRDFIIFNSEGGFSKGD